MLATNRFALLMLLGCLLTACDALGIFDGDSATPSNLQDADAAEILNLDVTGGIAGVHLNMSVASNGTLTYEDRTPDGARKTMKLTEAEFQSLTDLMTSNHFFELAETHISPNTADAFIYDITYIQGDQAKNVRTDDIAAPENLKRIVAGLRQLMENARDNGLQLELLLDRTQLKRGESVALTLRVKNLLSIPVVLHFRDGQIFDFLAFRSPADGVADRVIWRWSQDQVFTQALRDLTLAPGEERTYEVSWDGRASSGEMLSGAVALRAELVSTPGGTTRLQFLTISE